MSNLNWVPRALRKRGTEFNTGDGAASATAAASAPPLPSLASMLPDKKGAQVSWGGAADLDDLEEEGEEQRAKKPKPSPADAASAAEPPAASSGAAGGGAPPKPAAKQRAAAPSSGDEIIDAAPRMAVHIASSVKFTKVSAMAYSLLNSGRVTRENAGAFFTILEAGFDRRRVREPPLRVAYKRLYGAAVASASLFPASAQLALRRWSIHVLCQLELHTDDSFEFNAAAKTLREALHGLPCIYPALEPEGASHYPPSEAGGWVPALFDCVQSAMAHHKFAWARTSCDMLVKLAIDRRQNFDEAQQAELQEWNARCKGQKIARQQEAARDKSRELTTYEKDERAWRNADIAKSEGGRGTGGLGVDN